MLQRISVNENVCLKWMGRPKCRPAWRGTIKDQTLNRASQAILEQGVGSNAIRSERSAQEVTAPAIDLVEVTSIVSSGNEAAREGYPQLSGKEFVNCFCKKLKVIPATPVTRIEFTYV